MHTTTWMILGLLLIGGEVFIPSGFVILIVGVAFVLTGLFSYLLELGNYALTFEYQLVLAALLAIALLLTARKFLASCIKKNVVGFKDLSGELVFIIEEIEAGGIGKGEMRGSPWTVKNETAQPLKVGAYHRAAEVQGLTVIVR